MHVSAFIRTSLTLLLVGSLVCPPSYALVSINDGKNQIFLDGSVSYSYNSNLFANATSGGDSIVSASVGMEYLRHAGMIGVNSSLYLDASNFSKHTGQNFQNPRLHTEFTKESGRTTGALTLDVARESRADLAANIRDESWNYAVGLNFKYPVIERYTISGSIGYNLVNYIANPMLVNLATYTASTDLFYVYNSERDLIAGYRFRYSDTSAHSGYYDHAFTVGISGKILPKLNGTVRVGYQFQVPTSRLDSSNHALTASGSATWNLSKRFTTSFDVTKDFAITSTNIPTDATNFSVTGQFALTAHTALSAGLGYGITDFLGPLGNGRHDTYYSFNVGATHTFNDHLSVSMGYNFLKSRSNLAFAQFTRNTFTASASSRF